MLIGVTITRMWMARPFQTRSRHWDIDGSQCTEVAKEGCNAPGWITEQGKTLALGSGRISCQNPEVTLNSYKPQLEQHTKATSFAPHNIKHYQNTQNTLTTHTYILTTFNHTFSHVQAVRLSSTVSCARHQRM